MANLFPLKNQVKRLAAIFFMKKKPNNAGLLCTPCGLGLGLAEDTIFEPPLALFFEIIFKNQEFDWLLIF